MTNSKILLESNQVNANQSADIDELSVKQTTEISCNKSVPGVESMINNKNVKSAVSNSKTSRKNKNGKSNTNIQVRGKTENKKNEKKSPNDSENCHVPSPDKETLRNKRNNIKKIGLNKIDSPNHKLTEYFSDLRVDESENNAIIDENNTRKAESESKEKSSKDTILSPKQPLLNAPTPGRKTRQRKAQSIVEKTNHKVTEYFHVRRSERKYKKSIIDEKQKNLENKIINGSEDGLEIKEFEEKGRGIITTREFYKGEFVVEYIGELIDISTAKDREIKYAKNKNIGCYMYYFKHKNKSYCIDATEESGKLGRLVNHSRKGNLISRVTEVNEIPHLVLLAKTDISSGTELLYDYGDRNPETVKHHPWLNL